eukprot:CCRYP_019576-RA/>CCRYP_019576-RA protein AED:0.35 eAED:0.33 QI:0/0/0/0.5/0/0/2/0/72
MTLKTSERLGMREVVGHKLIVGAWETSDIMVTNVCVMPEGYRISNHMMFIVDFLKSTLIGSSPPKGVRVAAR